MLNVSVIVPVYNERDTVLEILQKIKDKNFAGTTFEVVVVDDGSTDGSRELLEARTDLYAKLIKMEKNSGKGAAVKAALHNCTGEYVLFQDADLEYDPADYRQMLDIAHKFSPDIVYGSRVLAPQAIRVAYFHHRFGNFLITLFFNILYNTTFTDIYSCYLMYKRKLVDVQQLRENGWSQHLEILARAVKHGRRFYEVPVSYYGRSFEEGKKIRWFHVFGVFKVMLKERFLR